MSNEKHQILNKKKLLLLIALVGLITPTAWTTTLTYEGSNRWLAPSATEPLKELVRKTSNGQRTFQVSLPEENRALSIQRLQIIQKSLEKAAGGNGLVIEESETPAPSNSLMFQEGLKP